MQPRVPLIQRIGSPLNQYNHTENMVLYDKKVAQRSLCIIRKQKKY